MAERGAKPSEKIEPAAHYFKSIYLPACLYKLPESCLHARTHAHAHARAHARMHATGRQYHACAVSTWRLSTLTLVCTGGGETLSACSSAFCCTRRSTPPQQLQTCAQLHAWHLWNDRSGVRLDVGSATATERQGRHLPGRRGAGGRVRWQLHRSFAQRRQQGHLRQQAGRGSNQHWVPSSLGGGTRAC